MINPLASGSRSMAVLNQTPVIRDINMFICFMPISLYHSCINKIPNKKKAITALKKYKCFNLMNVLDK